MPHLRNLALACVTLATLVPVAAFATTKCLCNDGMVVQSMDDDSDACDDACEEFGGGRVWTPSDAGYEDDNNTDDARREPVRDRVEQPPAQRR